MIAAIIAKIIFYGAPRGKGGGAKSDRGFLGRLAHIVNSRVDHNFDATC